MSEISEADTLKEKFNILGKTLVELDEKIDTTANVLIRELWRLG